MKTTALATAALVFGLLAAPSPARTWTDSTGQQQVEADFLDLNGGRVWLRSEARGSFNVALADLSKADQDYVREEMARRRAAIKTRPSQPGDVEYGPGRELCKLANPRIDESSGIACSRRVPGMFWTHNDSDDDARIYLFDAKGRDLGSCLLAGVTAYDWEDMASFKIGEKCYLLICDTGNNGRAAAVQMLYLVEEPPIDRQRGVSVKEVPVVQTIHYSYEDDYRDCEAVAIDPTDKTFYMVTKERGRQECFVYKLPWPENDAKRAFTARPIGKLRLPEVTGMDISPDGRRAAVVTYHNAYEFSRGEKEDWAAGFARPPREIKVPERQQGESIGYGPDGRTLYLTSEKRPAPLIEVPVKGEPGR